MKRSARAEAASLASDPHAPISAMIEIADRCNEVCVHCYQVQGLKGEMSTAELEAVMDELAEMGVLFLVLSGGEPTLRSDFVELVAYARSLRFVVKVYSNGLRIDEEMANTLGELAVAEVQMSLYSHRAEKHDWVTRVPGSFEKTVAAARFLRAAGVPVVLKTPLMATNVNEHREFIALVTELDAEYSLDPHLSPRENGERDPQMLRPDEASLRRLEDDLGMRRGRAQREAPPPISLEQRPCGACSGNVHVEANGEMRPCSQMTVPVGHAIRDGIQVAWSEDSNGLFIRSLAWGDLHGCRECDLRTYCTRCFADGRKAGDALGPYEDACASARSAFELAWKKPPGITAAAERGKALGPYREIGEGEYEAFDEVLTERDLVRRAHYAWILGEPTSLPPRGETGQLVQIRRPGQKSTTERVPE